MRFLIIIAVFAIMSCNSVPEQKTIGEESTVQKNELDTIVQLIDDDVSVEAVPKVILKENTNQSYTATKTAISQVRANINQYSISEDSLSKIFTDNLLNKIIPYWYGTKWSFEGHTNTPKKGEIACGYFVSTTLKHMGVNINRYKLAQQNPLNEAKTLALNSSIIDISKESSNENIKAINEALKEGIHFIGFGYNHVGYILKQEGQLFLIHSNYINSEGVIIESIEKSEVFTYFNQFFIAEISTNKELLDRWLKGVNIPVITD